jgi:long-chain acyl-CoA synthetase
MSLEFFNYIKAHQEKMPDHAAIIDGDHVVTYAELFSQIKSFATALANLNLNPDSKLGLLCLNQKEYLMAYLGALAYGLPVIPFNFLLQPEDMVYIAQDAGIDTMVIDSAFLKPATAPFLKSFAHKILVGEGPLEDLGKGTISWDNFIAQGPKDVGRHPRNPGIPDVILYTSGTTAKPKGVMLEERQFDINCTGFLEYLKFNADDRVIVALPLFHSFGNIMALSVLRVGGTLILMRQFLPKSILKGIAEQKATLLPLVPTIYSFLVDLVKRGGYDVSSLRYCISGGASLPEALLHKVEETLGVTVIEGYGLTETSPVISVNKVDEGSVPGSVGPLLNGVEVKIVDESGKAVNQGEVGEILVRAETVMKGYWKHEQATANTFSADGWLKTGDLGHMDERGRLYISAGRKKDLIIRAGENVSPLTIENALMNHPAGAEVAAVGIRDDRIGEKVKACVAIRQDYSVDDKELREYCRQKLPAFMIPDVFQFYDELPKGPTGKILKTELRDT